MGTRYNRGDQVVYLHPKEEPRLGKITEIRNPDSNSPTYVLESEGRKYESNASKLRKAEDVKIVEPMEDFETGNYYDVHLKPRSIVVWKAAVNVDDFSEDQAGNVADNREYKSRMTDRKVGEKKFATEEKAEEEFFSLDGQTLSHLLREIR